METLKLTPDSLTRINNDYYGNPRYYVSVVSFFSLKRQDESINDFAERLDSLRKNSILKKYRGKKFGKGYVFQSYNVNESCRHINEHLNSLT